MHKLFNRLATVFDRVATVDSIGIVSKKTWNTFYRDICSSSQKQKQTTYSIDFREFTNKTEKADSMLEYCPSRT